MLYCVDHHVPLEIADALDFDELEAFCVILGGFQDPTSTYDWESHQWIEKDK